jgi:hypothetical protein
MMLESSPTLPEDGRREVDSELHPAEAVLSDAEESERLRRARERLRIFGDPRMRLEVPHAWGGATIPLYFAQTGSPPKDGA